MGGKGKYLEFEPSSDKQKEAAAVWADPTVTDIVYGGAKGGGKSYLGAALIFGNALMYPGTRYFIARKQLNDLRKHTIPTIDKVFEDFGIDQKRYLKFNGQDNTYHLNNGSTVLLIEAKYWPRDPMYERFGSMTMTQGWIEEAGEFEHSAMINLSISIGRWLNDKYKLTGKLLQTCNPKKNYLYKEYYLPWRAGTLPPEKRFIQAFAHENKKNEAGYVKRLDEKLKGVDRERLLGGVWEYSEDADALIIYDKIIDCFSNDFVPGGDKKITSDIARLGGDRIVRIDWDGWRGIVTEQPRGRLNETAAYIEAGRHKLSCGKSDVLIDSDGMGVGINDFVGYQMFVNNSSALPDPLQPYDASGKEVKEQYENLKSQCYFRLADRINKNGLYLICENEDQQQLIIEELQQVRIKKLDSDGKKGVVPKDKVKEILGRSPDFADTIMMREYFELKPSFKFNDAEY
jgi:hypothetical protein